MLHLTKAPIYYVLGVIRFPRLADPKAFNAHLQSALRDDYPLVDDKSANVVQVEVGPEGLRLNNQTMQFWQMATLSRDRAVFAGPDVIGLHTTRYLDRYEFVHEFMRVLGIAQRAPELGVKIVSAVGLRYVDVIEPDDQSPLETLIDSRFLPGPIQELDGAKFQSGVMTSAFKTREGLLRVQVLRTPDRVLPPDLSSPLTEANKWGEQRPRGDFVVLDIDHGRTFDQPEILTLSRTRAVLLDLHSAIRAIFDRVSTPHAIDLWGVRNSGPRGTE